MDSSFRWNDERWNLDFPLSAGRFTVWRGVAEQLLFSLALPDLPIRQERPSRYYFLLVVFFRTAGFLFVNRAGVDFSTGVTGLASGGSMASAAAGSTEAVTG